MTNFNPISGSNINPLKTNPDAANKQAPAEEAPKTVTPEAAPVNRATLSADAVLNHLAQQAHGVKAAANRQVEERRIASSVAAFTQAWSPEDHDALVGTIGSILSEAGFKPGSKSFDRLVDDSVNRYFDKIWGEPAVIS